MNDPDYQSYSLDDLLDAQRHIDQKLYPARLALLRTEIRKREEDGTPEAAGPVAQTTAPGTGTKSVNWVPAALTVVALVLVGAAALAFVFVPGLLKLRQELVPIVTAVTESYPGQKVDVTINLDRSDDTRKLVITLVDSTWHELDDEPMKQQAEELASVAFGAHPDPESVTRVTVVFRTGSDHESYRFSPSELTRSGP